MNCEKKHSLAQSIANKTPRDQGGKGRHKCAACAYEKGYQDGISWKMQMDIEQVLEQLPYNQGGTGRHRSPYVAYVLGYTDGVLDSYKKRE